MKDYIDCLTGADCGSAYKALRATIERTQDGILGHQMFYATEQSVAIEIVQTVGSKLAAWIVEAQNCLTQNDAPDIDVRMGFKFGG